MLKPMTEREIESIAREAVNDSVPKTASRRSDTSTVK